VVGATTFLEAAKRMGATIGTKLYTRFFGEQVGTDGAGNTYYREKNAPSGRRERRWVIYGAKPEGSAVPSEWQGWLTHTLSESPMDSPPVERSWQTEHVPNPTGSERAYRPGGALITGGERNSATGDYQAWTPE
jgi:NADH:ubiquinone oxidoreductase subunit